MSQQNKQQKQSPIVSKGIITFNEAGKLEMSLQYPEGTRKVMVSAEHVRQIAELLVSKTGEVFAFVVDTKMSISQKTKIALPEVNEREIATRITSVDQLLDNSKTFPLIGYTGIMSDKAIKVASALAPICAPIGGGYFSGRSLLVDAKSWVGGINIPSQYKNMRVVHRKNKADTVIFSLNNTLQEMTVANVLSQQWPNTKVVSSLNDNVIFIGRPSITAEKVYVVTTKYVLDVNFTTYKVETVKPQPLVTAEMAVAFFKEGNTFISLTDSGASLELTTKAA